MDKDNVNWGGEGTLPPTEDNIVNFEDEILDNAVNEAVAEIQEQEQKLKDDFEEFQEMEKDLNMKSSNDDLERICNSPALDLILTEIMKNRITTIDLKDSISNKRVEAIDIYSGITTSLNWIKKRIGKWFIYVLLLSNFISFVLGGIANEHKETVYPLMGKAYNTISNLNKLKGE
jgi:hypothetical protein